MFAMCSGSTTQWGPHCINVYTEAGFLEHSNWGGSSNLRRGKEMVGVREWSAEGININLLKYLSF